MVEWFWNASPRKPSGIALIWLIKILFSWKSNHPIFLRVRFLIISWKHQHLYPFIGGSVEKKEPGREEDSVFQQRSKVGNWLVSLWASDEWVIFESSLYWSLSPLKIFPISWSFIDVMCFTTASTVSESAAILAYSWIAEKKSSHLIKSTFWHDTGTHVMSNLGDGWTISLTVKEKHLCHNQTTSPGIFIRFCDWRRRTPWLCFLILPNLQI